MTKLKSWISRQQLNIKFTIIIAIVVFIPVFGFFMLLFKNLHDNMNKHAEDGLKTSLSQNYASIQKTVDLCNTSTQVFLAYNVLHQFLVSLKQGENKDTLELMEFYKNDIGMLENIVNSNPYLYQIRVYAQNNDFFEMMPILFQRQRLEQFSWAKRYESGTWEFDYSDQLFSNSLNHSVHTMGLITSIEDYEWGEIGVIEVAIRMEDVFEGIFESTDQNWLAFIDNKGNVYSGGGEVGSIWEDNKKNVITFLANDLKKEQYYTTTLLGKDVYIGVYPVKELSGTMVHIKNLQDEKQEIYRMELLYISIMIVVFVLLVFFVNRIVKLLLKGFYSIVTTVKLIQEGDLDVRVSLTSEDEMGEFGKQINRMLDTIDRLMNENLNRELLMKNSQIKALQNQINAHFIYNVLESIKMMAEIDEKYAISDAVTSLGKLLRYGMKWSVKNVTVSQEIEYVKDYLNLINLRFDYEIILALNIPSAILKQEIPKMTLQPIVENAIYHGIEELAQDASIYIKAIVEETDFYIEITDSGKGMTQEQVQKLQKKITGEIETTGGSGNGIGLKNVQDRIQISFGEQYGISIISKEKCFTKVQVKLPINYKEGEHIE